MTRLMRNSPATLTRPSLAGVPGGSVRQEDVTEPTARNLTRWVCTPPNSDKPPL